VAPFTSQVPGKFLIATRLWRLALTLQISLSISPWNAVKDQAKLPMNVRALIGTRTIEEISSECVSLEANPTIAFKARARAEGRRGATHPPISSS
jgi:hypothetical protein